MSRAAVTGLLTQQAIPQQPTPTLPKAATGIAGFDEITFGGLPRGRATLVTGGPGSGKTLFGLEFLVRGARELDEPGVLLSFEESADELAANASSLGFDLPGLELSGQLAIDTFRIDVGSVVRTGDFDLDGLFIRLTSAVESVGARRVVLDTIEVLFTALGDRAIIRSELSRILRWLKDRQLTVILTGERSGATELTKFGIEEYVSDCVVVLDHRVENELATRRLRVAKYRGSPHGANEYPFMIGGRGLIVFPLTSVGLTHEAPLERVSTGIDRLDHMLGGGLYRGSTVLVSGSAGTGKTSLAAQMVDAACRRGERALYFSFEESPEQLLRNMSSIGLDLNRWVDDGLLSIRAVRPTAYGLEEHLVELHRMLDDSLPSVAVLDAMGGLSELGTPTSVNSTFARQIDLIKHRGVTGVLTSLTHGDYTESSAMAVSSLVDTWVVLRNTECDGERNRLLYVIKSRGSAHSNQVREFVLTDGGAELLDVYVGPQGVLTGSARVARQAEERLAAEQHRSELSRSRDALARRAQQVEQQISALRSELARDRAELENQLAEEISTAVSRSADRDVMAARRWADPASMTAEQPAADD